LRRGGAHLHMRRPLRGHEGAFKEEEEEEEEEEGAGLEGGRGREKRVKYPGWNDRTSLLREG
jgi:hypothetical protein